MPIAQVHASEQLLRCLSGGGNQLSEAAARLNWDDVVAAGVEHRLAPLLYRRLKQAGIRASLPRDVWERLRRAYLAGAARNARLFGELGVLLRRLRGSGIRVIGLKGAFLAEAVYEDIALRQMVDVDLLVPRAELPAAYAALLDMERILRLPSVNRPGFGSSWELRLPVDAGVDFCWAIAIPGGRSRLDVAGLWNRARPAIIAGVEVLALSCEDLLLQLCLHATHRHGLEDGLRPFVDIAKTTRRYRDEIDWTQVAERAREWGASRYVGLALRLARSMLDAQVPGEALDRLVPGGLDLRMLATARHSVLARTGYVEQIPFLNWVGATSLAEIARLSWERVFLSREEMSAMYAGARDSNHLGLYHALRLRDVVGDYLSHTLRRARLAMRSRGQDPNAPLLNWLRSGSQS
jgi:hypothetical protein